MEADDMVLSGSGNDSVENNIDEPLVEVQDDMRVVVVSVYGMEVIMAQYIEGGEEYDNYVVVRHPLVVQITLTHEGLPFLYYKKVLSWTNDEDSCLFRFEKPFLLAVKPATDGAKDFYKAASNYMFDSDFIATTDQLFKITADSIRKELAEIKVENVKRQEEPDSAAIAANTSIN